MSTRLHARRRAIPAWLPRVRGGWRRALVPCMLAAIALMGPDAAAADATLARLARSGRIVLGANDGVVPLSYLDEHGNHVGYQVDVCLHIVRAVQQYFDVPRLEVKTLPTTAATRLSLLDNASIDIECGYNPVTPSVRAQASPTYATMVSEFRLMVPLRGRTPAWGDLDGATVGMVSGSSAGAALRTMARDRGVRIQEAFARQSVDLLAMLEAGQVDAVVLPAATLKRWHDLNGRTARFAMLEGVLLAEPVAPLFRSEDRALHALANEVVAAMMKSGEMARLYEKWFLRPIPGAAQPLGLPLPAALQRLFDAPGSEAAQAQ